MFEQAEMVFIHCRTPLHAGAEAGLEFVDLPIQREVQNEFPTIYGSGIKGALKARARSSDGSLSDEMKALFGADVSSGDSPDREVDDHNSAMSFTDARVLAFPVKSLNDLFAWVTCPLALAKYAQDKVLVSSSAVTPDVLSPQSGQCYVSTTNRLVVGDDKIVLEDSAFEAAGDCDAWRDELALQLFGRKANGYWKTKFDSSLVVLSDQDFGDFVKRSTQVAPRIRIVFETGRVDEGALWYEEHLPVDTILYTLALAARPTRESQKSHDADWAMTTFNNSLLANDPCVQFGGDETVGKGLVSLIRAKGVE